MTEHCSCFSANNLPDSRLSSPGGCDSHCLTQGFKLCMDCRGRPTRHENFKACGVRESHACASRLTRGTPTAGRPPGAHHEPPSSPALSPTYLLA
eukprot:750105-Hanusia_phi.AAC.2